MQKEAGGSGFWLLGQGGEPAQLASRRGWGRALAGKQKPREHEVQLGDLGILCAQLDPGWAPLLRTGQVRPYQGESGEDERVGILPPPPPTLSSQGVNDRKIKQECQEALVPALVSQQIILVNAPKTPSLNLLP